MILKKIILMDSLNLRLLPNSKRQKLKLKENFENLDVMKLKKRNIMVLKRRVEEPIMNKNLKTNQF